MSYDAALLSQAVGKPVRVQLSRKDEMAWENYGNAYVIDERAGLDAAGNIVAWDHESWSPTLGQSARLRHSRQRRHRSLVGLRAGAVRPPHPRARSAAVPTTTATASPSYVAGSIGGKADGTGTIKSERVLLHNVRSAFLTGPLRSPARLQNTFAHECLWTSSRRAPKADPVAYRLRHLRDPRLIDVAERRREGRELGDAPVAQARTPPRPASPPAAASPACCTKATTATRAMVVEVEVNQDTGKIAVKRIVVAQRLRPDLESRRPAQSDRRRRAAGHEPRLGEEVTWDDQKVTSVDWRPITAFRSASTSRKSKAC